MLRATKRRHNCHPSWETLGQVSEKLASAGLPPDHSVTTGLKHQRCDVEQAQKVLKLIDVLEDLDDVQEVYSNGQFQTPHTSKRARRSVSRAAMQHVTDD